MRNMMKVQRKNDSVGRSATLLAQIQPGEPRWTLALEAGVSAKHLSFVETGPVQTQPEFGLENDPIVKTTAQGIAIHFLRLPGMLPSMVKNHLMVRRWKSFDRPCGGCWTNMIPIRPLSSMRHTLF